MTAEKTQDAPANGLEESAGRHPSRAAAARIPFGESIIRLNSAQKPGAGVPAYTRWVNRRVARLLAAAFAAVGWSPSAVSVLSIVVTLSGLGTFLLLQPHPFVAGVVAAAGLALGYALDSADGQLARLQGTSSLQGEWLDHTLDAVRLPAVHCVVAAGFLANGDTALAVFAVLFSIMASASFLSQNVGGLLRDNASVSRASVRPFQSWILLPTDPGVLCWVFALWAWPMGFAVAYVGLFALNSVHALMSSHRRWRELEARS
jgi:phosphatidylglycerophosphate synthase